MTEMAMDEITILGATNVELFAYIGLASVDKEWPSEIVFNGSPYSYEACWTLPTKMRNGYVKVARYLIPQL